MATSTPEYPSAPPHSKSFTRLASHTSPFARSRASTLQNGRIPQQIMADMTTSSSTETNAIFQNDIFEKSSLINDEADSRPEINRAESTNGITDVDELPIELISLIDRFIESLGAKIYTTPPTIDKLSTIFQDFYTTVESHTATHINALSTRQSRRASPSASISSRSSQQRQSPRSSSRDTLGFPGGAGPEQQMLTPQEVSDRRRVRRLLDQKGLALVESVEKRVCERVYGRIWRHRSTLDEVRDEKLRSRTAALALVGIGLRDLGIDMKASPTQAGNADIEDWIARARDGLLRMNEAKHPLGKLQQLAAAHKNIVDLLTTLHQGSSSADEILPTLIYTLITTPPEGINVISNLHFIQRFRASSKVDGEAAYCLTNLEAAITFLETVDLASLRSDESLEGPSPPKASSSRPATPQSAETVATTLGMPMPATMPSPSSAIGTVTSKDKARPMTPPSQSSDRATAPTPRPTPHQRRISNLFQPPATAIGAAGDAVRNTADQGIKSIGGALDNSFKLLFGRLGEHRVAAAANDTPQSIVVPKTLDEARKLVEPKPAEDDDVVSSASSIAEKPGDQISSNPKADDSLLSAIAGRKQPRDHSVDSHTSSKNAQLERGLQGNGAVESMLSLGSTLNPLKGFGGMSMMRGFGRSSSSGTPTPTVVGAVNNGKPVHDQQGRSCLDHVPDAGIETLPPLQHFLDMDDVKDLRVGEVSELLQDYKRLAEALRTLGAFS